MKKRNEARNLKYRIARVLVVTLLSGVGAHAETLTEAAQAFIDKEHATDEARIEEGQANARREWAAQRMRESEAGVSESQDFDVTKPLDETGADDATTDGGAE